MYLAGSGKSSSARLEVEYDGDSRRPSSSDAKAALPAAGAPNVIRAVVPLGMGVGE